jgi:hypothetical protein
MYIVQYKIHQKWKKNIKKTNLFKNPQNMPWLDNKSENPRFYIVMS